jgi:hypothetical protein
VKVTTDGQFLDSVALRCWQCNRRIASSHDTFNSFPDWLESFGGSKIISKMDVDANV